MASRNFHAVAIKKLQEILAEKGYTAEMLFEKYDISFMFLILFEIGRASCRERV